MKQVEEKSKLENPCNHNFSVKKEYYDKEGKLFNIDD